jgi:hypothetical protein
MVVPRITEINEKGQGLYVVCEYRHNESDEKPFHVEEFDITRWNTARTRVITDRGRVKINGEWVWPKIEVEGRWVHRPDIDLAEKETVKVSSSEMENFISRIVVEHGEKLSSVKDLPEDNRHPYVKRGTKTPRDKMTKKARANLVNKDIKKTIGQLLKEDRLSRRIQ